VKDGLATGQDVVCQVTKAEVPFYRAILKGSGLLSSTPGENSVTIQPIETKSSGELDGPLPSFVSGERRELVDLDELDLDRCEDLIGTITIPDSTPRSSQVGRICALHVDGANAGILDLLQRVNPTARVIDLAMQQDTFSSMFNMKHKDILGN